MSTPDETPENDEWTPDGGETPEEKPVEDTPKPAAVKAKTRENVPYYKNISKLDQAVIGPDSASRVVPTGALVHISQFQNEALPEKARGQFLRMKNLTGIEEGARNKRLVVIGGPFNNMQGVYRPNTGRAA